MICLLSCWHSQLRHDAYYFIKKDRGNLKKTPLLTCITFSFTAWDEAGALGAGTAVPSWSEQTQVAAGSLAWILHCKYK